MQEKFYITTPIFYPNGMPHIGHAYCSIATDALARFQRADGKNTYFVSGTDEHGLKMQQAAEKLGITPQELADQNSAIFRKMLKELNCSNDAFLRTSEERHYRACQEMWQRMEKNGDIYLDRYEGWYSVTQEAYYDENDTIVDQDGVRREKEVGSKVEWNEEESYFFRLSKYEQPLLEYCEKNEGFICPIERRNEIVSFIKSGLKDLSISRTAFDWGIPVPGNPKHVMYVWVDALTTYLTATGFPDKDAELASLWPANAHIIGKDIIRFHAIYWPAFLMSAGIALPKRIFAHGFLLNRGVKMSKSFGNVVDPFEIAEKYGVDQMRYFFLRDIPFGQDGSYSHDAIVSRTNADLANDLGNLAQRSLSMIAKNNAGRVPEPGVFLPQDELLLAQSVEALKTAREAMEKQALHLALAAIMGVVAEANRYFAGEEPWALRKTDEKRFGTVLYVTAEILRRVGIMMTSFIPQSAHKLLDSLAIPAENRKLVDVISSQMNVGVELPAPEPVFPRYVEESNAD